MTTKEYKTISKAIEKCIIKVKMIGSKKVEVKCKCHE